MNPKKNGAMRKKVRQIYNFIEESLYLNRPDLEINGSRFNSAVFNLRGKGITLIWNRLSWVQLLIVICFNLMY